MRKKWYERLPLCLLLLGVIYFVFTDIQERERSLAELRKLRQIVTELAERPPVTMGQLPANTSSAPVANARSFDPKARFGGELVSVLSSDPPGFNPLTVNEASARQILSLCTASLAERNWEKPEKFEPMLAESWTISPDHKTYTVQLRQGVMWQSFTDPDSGKRVPPQELTAEDFKFAVDTILDPKVNCAALRGYYLDLEKVETVGKYTLIFHWKKEYYGSMDSTLTLSPLPRHFYCSDGKFDAEKFNSDHQRNRMIVGCGPYKLRSWEKDRRIVLERSENYFGTALGIAPPLQRRVFEIIKLPNTQFQALTGGKVGMLSLTPELWTRRAKEPAFTSKRLLRYRYPSLGYSYIGYNQARPCFRDKLTRQALTLLIDRQKILDQVLFGCGRIVNGPFTPGTAYADPALKPYPYDPERAKALLRQAGWRDTDGDGILERDGEKFIFTMMQISGSSTQAKTLPMIQESFAAAGIKMNLQTLEWSVYIDRLNQRNFDACNLGWTGSIDPDLYQIFHSSQCGGSGSNFIGYANAELDKLIMDLRKEFDMEKRIALCWKMEKILYEDQPYTFMFASDALVALDARYRNVKLYPLGLEPLAFWFSREGK